MVVVAWTVTTVIALTEAWRTAEQGPGVGYIGPVNLFAGAYLVIALYMLLCWTRAVLEQRRASVRCDAEGVHVVDWRNALLSIAWADVTKVAAVDYGGFCKPARVVIYGPGNLVHEFSPWLISPETLLECLVERASLQSRARTWSRQIWT